MRIKHFRCWNVLFPFRKQIAFTRSHNCAVIYTLQSEKESKTSKQLNCWIRRLLSLDLKYTPFMSTWPHLALLVSKIKQHFSDAIKYWKIQWMFACFFLFVSQSAATIAPIYTLFNLFHIATMCDKLISSTSIQRLWLFSFWVHWGKKVQKCRQVSKWVLESYFLKYFFEKKELKKTSSISLLGFFCSTSM